MTPTESRGHEQPTPPHKPPADPPEPKKDGDEDDSDDKPPKSAAEAQQQQQALGDQVAKLKRQEETIAEHSAGVIPPVPPAPSMADLVKAAGGK